MYNVDQSGPKINTWGGQFCFHKTRSTVANALDKLIRRRGPWLTIQIIFYNHFLSVVAVTGYELLWLLRCLLQKSCNGGLTNSKASILSDSRFNHLDLRLQTTVKPVRPPIQLGFYQRQMPDWKKMSERKKKSSHVSIRLTSDHTYHGQLNDSVVTDNVSASGPIFHIGALTQM